MNIVKIQSDPPKSEFAPIWNFPIGITEWNAFEKIDTIRTWLLSNESRIINEFPNHGDRDGGTGLGPDSVTARFGRYNLFNFSSELAEFDSLLDFLRKSYIKFVQETNHKIQDTNIVSWFNVLRKSEKIKEHAHGSHPYAYLSGNMHLDSYKTITYYRSPYDKNFLNVKNIKGGLTIFPACILHGTDDFDGDFRVSIGFDLWLDTTTHPTDVGLNPIPFINKDILKTL